MSGPMDTRLSAPEQLRTAARPVTVYEGAPAPATGADRLARALAEVTPALQGVLHRMHQERMTEAEGRAQDALSQMGFEQAQQLVSSGALRETESPYYQAAFQKQFGLALAGRRRREIAEAYETSFDRVGGDLDEFLRGFAQADAAEYGDNPMVASGLREGMAGFFERMRDHHADWRNQQTQETARDRFIDVIRGAADRALERGGNPSEAVRALYEGHRQMLGLSYAEMDDMVLQVAEEYANQGNSAAVRALLETEAVGDDGQRVGSFVNRSRHSLSARALIDRAVANEGESLRRENTYEFVRLATRADQGALNARDMQFLETARDSGQMSQEQHESLLRRHEAALVRGSVEEGRRVQELAYMGAAAEHLLAGRGHLLTDHTYIDPAGEERTIRRDDAVRRVQVEIMDRMAASGEYSIPEMATTLAQMGADPHYPVWEQTLTDGMLSINQFFLSPGADGASQLSQPARDAFSLWKNLSHEPHLRNRLVGDQQAQHVYQDAEALVRLGFDEDTALIRAAQGRAYATARGAGVSQQVDRTTLRREVQAAAQTGNWFTSWFSSRVDNEQYVSDTVEEGARILMQSGVPAQRAIQEAARMFRESHTSVNGVAVNTRNRYIPPDFEEISTAAVSHYAANNGADARDLTLVPVLGSNEQFWVVAYRGTLIPHENWLDGGGRLHITQLQTGADYAREAINAGIARRGERERDFREMIDGAGSPWWLGGSDGPTNTN